MARPIEAVVFDMDGILIDSEPIWREIERQVFSRVGVELTEADLRDSMGVRIDQVVDHRYRRYRWQGPTPREIESQVLDAMTDFIEERGVLIDGAAEAVAGFRSIGLRLALASSSPYRLIEAVLSMGAIAGRFDVIYSAEEEVRGKPDPAVYLTTARLLGVDPARCLAVEDSANGVIAAKAAGMVCVAIPDDGWSDGRFPQADLVLSSVRELDERVFSATGTAPSPRR